MILRKGLKVWFDGKVLSVLERKREIEKKPKFFLFDVKDKAYISSLYLVSKFENSGTIQEIYHFDYRDVNYVLEVVKKDDEVVSKVYKTDDFEDTGQTEILNFEN